MGSRIAITVLGLALATGCDFDTGVPLAEDPGLDDRSGPGPDAGAEPDPEPDPEPEPEPEPGQYRLSTTGTPENVFSDGGGGGSPFVEVCGQGRVVTGFDGDDNDSGLCRLQAFCSVLTANPDGTVTTSEPLATELHGSETSVYPKEPIRCPDNQVVVGVRTADQGSLITGLEIRCAPLSWDLEAESYQIGDGELLNQGFGDDTETGGNCDSGEVASGFGGRAGTLVDQFILYCQPLAASAL
jgi:hypothetical protein